MKLGIMQPYFFPYIGYWQLMNAVDCYVIYDDVQYITRGWVSRNRILCAGNAVYYTLPLRDASQNKRINEIEVLNNPVTKRKMIATIETCYKRAPYYDQTYSIVRDVLEYSEMNLALRLEYSLRCICQYLGIKTKLLMSSNIEKDSSLKGQEKIISICKILNATEYYNAIGGKELYSTAAFKAAGIDLKFVRTNSIKYEQFNNDFIPNLSIIDVMMFNSPESIRGMLDDYTLI